MEIKNVQSRQNNRLNNSCAEPASSIDSILHGFVSRENKPCETNNLTDEKLYELCKKFGKAALFWRQKFIGLLPEVYKRRLFEKKGFGSIFEFAKKLAGLSEEQVRRVLSLEKKFEEMPGLHTALVNGEVSLSKLAKVASIATLENDEELAMQAKLLPRSALETLVRDQKRIESVPGNTKRQQLFQNANGADAGKSGCRSELKLSPEVMRKLFELQQKGIDVNKLILEFLEKRELEIAQEKEEIAAEFQAKPAITTKDKNNCSSTDETAQQAKSTITTPALIQHPAAQQVKKPVTTISRYIPARVRKILKAEHGTKCSIAICQKPAEIIHHTQRFSLSRNHDPRFLAPLCREHHAIAHSMDIKYQKVREQNESAGGCAHFANARPSRSEAF